MDMDTQSSEAYTAFTQILKVYLTDRDVDTLMTLVTDDVSGIGTGAQEIALGKPALRALYTQEVTALPMPIAFQIADYWESSPAEGVYNCYAWVNTSLNLDDEKMSLPTRMTLLFVKKGPRLLASQIHISAPNVEQEDDEFFPVQKALSEELLFNNEVCGIIQYRLYPDMNIRVERLNKEAARILEISQKDVLSHKLIPLASTVYSDDLPVVEERAALETGASSEPREYRSLGQEGSLTWVVGYSSALDRATDEDGNPYELLQSIVIDIDEKKRSELELQKYILEQQLDTYRADMEDTLRGLGIGFWYVIEDPDRGPLLFLNDAAADAVALAPDEEPLAAFHTFIDNMLPDDRDAFLQCYKDIYEKGNAECTYRYRHSVRGLRYIQCSGWWDGDQRRGFFIDVTERVEKERQYQQALEETNAALKEALTAAQQANAAKTRFLSNMSHDIRTPMNAIIGFSTIAARRINDVDKVRDCLSKILSSSEHLLGLINDILDMSRIEAGKTTLEPSKTTISEIIRNVMSIIQSQIQSKQLNFYVDALDIRDEYIFADTLKTRQILLNILGNAVKFTHAEGTVSMKIAQLPTRTQGYGAYRFVIKDNGVGMSEAFMDHIFEPFEREKSSTISGTTGTGLGMSITKNLIDMMGGSITVKSKLGEGSEFTVDLEFQLQTDIPRDQRIEELKGLRVLVVDDDFQICESITKMLGSVGMRSDWTMTPREALHRVEVACSENDRFYGYIIDWSMPEMNGIELTRRIRKIVGNDTPIILTAYDWENIADEAKEAGVSAFCSKPLFMSDLTKALLKLPEGHLPEEKAKVMPPLKRTRILLVEDNELNSEIAKELLEEQGLLIDAVYNGAEALDVLNSSNPNFYKLILMDIQMPVMDGFEATKQIRRSTRPDLRDIPIIAMTANAFHEDRSAALAAGMNDHLAKPLNMQKVIEVISRYVDLSK